MFSVMALSAYQIADAERSGTFRVGTSAVAVCGSSMGARRHNGGPCSAQTQSQGAAPYVF